MPTVDVFEREPDLLDGVPAHEKKRARLAGEAPAISLDCGPWGGIERPSDARHLGCLILEGFVSHRTTVGNQESMELLGPGDVLRPWVELEQLSVPSQPYWHVESRAQLAVLDAGFSERVTAWPHIASALMDRLAARTRALGVNLAISAANRADTRLLYALWYCADRWGRVTHDGVVVELPLTHELFGHLVGVERPSVTTAVGQLERQGKVRRPGRHMWLLLGGPPSGAHAPAG